LSEIKKSAYWTLVEAGKLINIPHDKPLSIELPTATLFLYGFPFGFPLHAPNPPISERSDSVHIAVIHDYCWQSGFSYPGAPTEKSAEEHSQSARNYNVLHFGDNHKGFLKRVNRHQIIFNGGTFYRRNIDEADYRPMVGLVYDNGDVKPVYVPINEDILSVKVQETKSEENVEIDNFVNYLSKISLNGIDIEEAIAQYMVMHSVSDAVCTEITGLLEITRHG
jgi:hypothetical protein